MERETKCYGALLERGVVIGAEDGGYVLRSLDRPGLVTPPLRAADGAAFTEGSEVLFVMFQDGDGAILAAGSGGQS